MSAEGGDSNASGTPDYSAMKVSELKPLLQAKGLSTSGNKAALIARLEESVASGNDNDDGDGAEENDDQDDGEDGSGSPEGEDSPAPDRMEEDTPAQASPVKSAAKQPGSPMKSMSLPPAASPARQAMVADAAAPEGANSPAAKRRRTEEGGHAAQQGAKKSANLPPAFAGIEVLLTGLPSGATEEDVTTLLSSIPESSSCTSIKLLKGQSGNSLRSAVASYPTAVAASGAAAALKGKELEASEGNEPRITTINARTIGGEVVLLISDIPKTWVTGDGNCVALAKALGEGILRLEALMMENTEADAKGRGLAVALLASDEAAKAMSNNWARLPNENKPVLKVNDARLWVALGSGVNLDEEEAALTVKAVHISTLSPACTEPVLREKFTVYGTLDKIVMGGNNTPNRRSDFAIINFKARNDAIDAVIGMKGFEYEGRKMDVTLAKPPTKRKERDDRFGHDNRHNQRGGGQGGRFGGGPRGAPGGGRFGFQGRGDFQGGRGGFQGYGGRGGMPMGGGGPRGPMGPPMQGRGPMGPPQMQGRGPMAGVGAGWGQGVAGAGGRGAFGAGAGGRGAYGAGGRGAGPAAQNGAPPPHGYGQPPGGPGRGYGQQQGPSAAQLAAALPPAPAPRPAATAAVPPVAAIPPVYGAPYGQPAAAGGAYGGFGVTAAQMAAYNHQMAAYNQQMAAYAAQPGAAAAYQFYYGQQDPAAAAAAAYYAQNWSASTYGAGGAPGVTPKPP